MSLWFRGETAQISCAINLSELNREQVRLVCINIPIRIICGYNIIDFRVCVFEYREYNVGIMKKFVI